MFKNNKLFFWTVEILSLAVLVFVFGKIGYIFKPVGTLFKTVFIPFLIAGFLFYTFDPLLKFLEKRFKIKRSMGIFIVFLVLIALIIFMVMSFIPSIITQLGGAVNATTKAIPEIQKWIEHLADKPEFKNLDLQDLASKMNLSYSDIFKNVAGGVSGSLNGVMSTVGKVGIVLVLAPILLYYMLKDGHKFLPYLQRTILKNDRLNIAGLLKDLNNTIARYVSGASTDCFIVFVAVFIGYLIGGVPYAFLFATFSAITNLIPYIGPYIGVLPVVLIVAPENWVKALFAVLYVLAVQQIDGNFIYPKIVGNAMKIHPVTIMVLMLVMGNLYGLVGMLIAVPAYSIVKEIIRFIVEVYENHKHNKIVDKPKVSDKKN